MPFNQRFNESAQMTPRGIKTSIPRPPDEVAERNFLYHIPSVPFSPKNKNSIERSASNYISGAKKTPVPPYQCSNTPIVPAPSPQLAPQQSSFNVSSPRRKVPAVREPNQMTFEPSVTALDTFFEKTAEDVYVLKKSQRTLRSLVGSFASQADGLSSQGMTPLPGLTTASGSARSISPGGLSHNVSSHLLQARTPRFTTSKYILNREGVIGIHPDTTRRENSVMKQVPDIPTASCYQYRSTHQEKDLKRQQKEFDEMLLSPRSVIFDLGKFDVQRNAVVHN